MLAPHFLSSNRYRFSISICSLSLALLSFSLTLAAWSCPPMVDRTL